MDSWGLFLTALPGLATSFGAGSSPFVTAILFGKLITAKAHNEIVTEVKANAIAREALLQKELDRAIVARDNEQKAKEVERARADAATTKLAEVATELGATAVHLLGTLPKSVPDA